MDSFRAQKVCVAALLAFLMSAGPAPAEVKLRIYLQDGSLQAGSLVTENPKTFVILTQEGRVEIPKNSIMFINGKTLKQWQDRPDKLFSTEIIPSEIPNPAFVNDKSLPPVPQLQKTVVKVEKTEPVKAPVPVKPAEPAKPVDSVKPAEPAPSPKEEPAAETAEVRTVKKAPPAPVAKAPRQRVREKAAPVAVEPVKKPSVAMASVEPLVSVAMPPAGRGRFDRLSAGASHHEKARAYQKAGELGRSMQEYHYARLLQPGNADIYLSLGQLYLGHGLRAEARKLLTNSSLRKSSEAKKLVAGIDADLAQMKKATFNRQVATGAAAFSWLPILFAMRFWRRRKPVVRTTTITADELASPVRAPEPEPTLEEVVAAVEPMPAPEPEPDREPEQEPAAPKSYPGLPEFLSNLTKNVPPEPVVAEETISLPVEEPSVSLPEPEPESEPEIVAEPVREPLPVVAGVPPDPEEILAMARTVEHSLIRGNQFAVSGQLEEARRSYRTALALNTGCASAHIGLAFIAFSEEKWEVALLHYRKALEIDPMSADAHYGVARVLLEINRVDDALPELRATLQIDPTYDDARDTLTALSKPA